MRKARIAGTNEIVNADDLLKLYPNYNELIFICIDDKCLVRMAPSCITKKDRRKPHFKKYRNREHIETCEYATLSKLYQKGKGEKLNNIEIKKIGYPSVFDVSDDKVEESQISQVNYNNEDEGVTGRDNGIVRVYNFDGENIKFDRSNKVRSIDRIVNWYLGFPYNRDVLIEISGNKIEYRYFFKKIDTYTDPATLLNERIFYGRLMISTTNENVFTKSEECVILKLLGYKDKVENNFSNYTIKIDKTTISKHSLSKLKNHYNELFKKAFADFHSDLYNPNVGLYVFVYGTLDNDNDTQLNVKKHHITFRYDEVRKTEIE